MRLIVNLALAWIFAACAVAQTPVITRIDVSGAERLKAEAVVAASGLKPGLSADRATLQGAVERMMATGLFERVTWKTQPGEAGVAVTLAIREAPEREAEEAPQQRVRIRGVVIEGVSPERVARLKSTLDGAMIGREYRKDVVEEVGLPLIRAAMIETGHWSSTAEFRLGDGAALVIQVTEGPVTKVGEPSIYGGDARWITHAGFVQGEPAESKKLNRAVGRVIEAARNEGYLSATARADNTVVGERLNVRVLMEKGPLYRFGMLQIEGLNEQGEARARKLWKLAPGEVVAAHMLESWIQRVFEQRIPPSNRVQREWRPRPEAAVADAYISFR